MNTHVIKFTKSLLGSYCEYKGEMYIITRTNGQLLHITQANSPAQLQVKESSVVITKHRPAPMVSHSGKLYIRTGNGHIFSALTGRLMNWADDHGYRKAIMAAE